MGASWATSRGSNLERVPQVVASAWFAWGENQEPLNCDSLTMPRYVLSLIAAQMMGDSSSNGSHDSHGHGCLVL